MSLFNAVAKPLGRNLRDLMLLCGFGPRLDAPDRQILEETIFPYLLERDDLQRILFVGCHWYTWHYNKVFASREYWTLEIDPSRKRYGSRRHITDSIEHVAKHFDAGSLDAVLMLGVIGWGLDDPCVADRAVDGIFHCLRPGGIFINAWDDVPEHRPFAIRGLPALHRFLPWVFPPLESAQYRCEDDSLRHTFDFYQRQKTQPEADGT